MTTWDVANRVTKWETVFDTISQKYDGDGRAVKRVETRSDPLFTSTIFYLRSSVMGGLPVAEINQAGKREVGYVYANGMEIARYRKPSSSQGFEVQWSHVEPMTGDRIEGGVSITTDPLGGLVTGSDPFVVPDVEYGDLLEGRTSHTSDSDPFSLGSGCALDGVPVDCNLVIHMLDIGSAAVKVTSGVNEKIVPARVTSGVNETIVSANAIGIGGSWIWDTTDPEPTDFDSGSGEGIRLGVSVRNWAWRWVPFGGGFGFSGIRRVGSQQQDLKEIWRQHKEEEEAKRKPAPIPKPCDSYQPRAYFKIASILGGTFQESKPGSPDSIATVVGVTISHDEAVSRLERTLLSDPLHPGGTDTKYWFEGRWYHVIIGYGHRMEKQIKKWLGEEIEVTVSVQDNTRPPSFVEMHCDPEEPGTWEHFWKYIGRKIGVSK